MGCKNETILENRRAEILERIKQVKNYAPEINRIAEDLHLSTRTIYRDLEAVGFFD